MDEDEYRGMVSAKLNERPQRRQLLGQHHHLQPAEKDVGGGRGRYSTYITWHMHMSDKTGMRDAPLD